MKKCLGAIITTLCILTTVSGCSLAAAAEVPKEKAIAVKAVTPKLKDVSASSEMMGRIVPAENTAVIIKYPGYVSEVYVSEGDTVTEGQTLFQLDTVDFDNQIRQAKDAVKLAQANYNMVVKGTLGSQQVAAQNGVSLAKAQYDALSDSYSLLSSAATSAKKLETEAKTAFETAQAAYKASPTNLSLQTTFEAAKTAYADAAKASAEASSKAEGARIERDMAKTQYTGALNSQNNLTEDVVPSTKSVASAQLDQAKTALAMAEEAKEYATVTAPVSGKVAELQVKKHQPMSNTAPALLLFQEGVTKVSFGAAPGVANSLNVGDAVLIDDTISANITKIPSLLNMNTGLYEIEAEALEGDYMVGTAVNVKILSTGGEKAFVLPALSVKISEEECYVWRIESDRAIKTPVEIGLIQKDSVEIISGVNETMHIVATITPSIKENSLISVVS